MSIGSRNQLYLKHHASITRTVVSGILKDTRMSISALATFCYRCGSIEGSEAALCPSCTERKLKKLHKRNQHVKKFVLQTAAEDEPGRPFITFISCFPFVQLNLDRLAPLLFLLAFILLPPFLVLSYNLIKHHSSGNLDAQILTPATKNTHKRAISYAYPRLGRTQKGKHVAVHAAASREAHHRKPRLVRKKGDAVVSSLKAAFPHERALSLNLVIGNRGGASLSSMKLSIYLVSDTATDARRPLLLFEENDISGLKPFGRLRRNILLRIPSDVPEGNYRIAVALNEGAKRNEARITNNKRVSDFRIAVGVSPRNPHRTP